MFKNRNFNKDMVRPRSTKVHYWSFVLVSMFMIGLVGTLPRLVQVLWRTTAQAVSTVNGLPISKEEFRFAVMREQRLVNFCREQYGADYREVLARCGKSEQVEESVLDQLITEKLFLDVARSIPLVLHAGYVVHELGEPAILKSLLGEVPPPYLFNQDGSLKVDILRKFLAAQHISLKDFEQFGEQLMKERLAARLAQGAAVVSKAQEKYALIQAFSKREFSCVTVPLKESVEMVSKEPISETELIAFYEAENREHHAYFSPERRDGTIWKFSLSDFKETNSARPLTPREQFLLAGERALESGNASVLANFISEHIPKKTQVKKVSLPENQEADPALTHLFELAKVGERKLFADDKNGYLLEVTEISAPERLSVETVRVKLEKDFQEKRAFDTLAKLLKEHREPSNAQKATGVFDPVVPTDKKGAPTKASIPDVLQKLGFKDASFLDSMLRVGDTHIVRSPDGRFAVCIRITHVSEPNQIALAEAGGLEKVRQQNLLEAQMLLLRGLVADLKSGARMG